MRCAHPFFKLTFTQIGALRPPPCPRCFSLAPPPKNKQYLHVRDSNLCRPFDGLPRIFFFIPQARTWDPCRPVSIGHTSYHWNDEYYYYKFIVYTKLLDSPIWQFREQIRQTPPANPPGPHPPPPPPNPEDTRLKRL